MDNDLADHDIIARMAKAIARKPHTERAGLVGDLMVTACHGLLSRLGQDQEYIFGIVLLGKDQSARACFPGWPHEMVRALLKDIIDQNPELNDE